MSESYRPKLLTCGACLPTIGVSLLIVVILLCISPAQLVLVVGSELNTSGMRATRTTLYIDIPTLKVNEQWRYTRITDTVQPDYELHTTDDITYKVKEVIEVTQAGVSYYVYNITFHSTTSGSLYFEIKAGGYINPEESYTDGFIWRRVDDLALVREYRYSYITLYSGEGGTGVKYGYAEADTTIAYMPPEELYDFPILVNDPNWHTHSYVQMWGMYKVDSTLYSDEGTYEGDGYMINTVVCFGTMNIEVPSGSFDVYHIHAEAMPGSLTYDPNEDNNGKITYWFADNVKSYVKWEAKNIDFGGDVVVDYCMEELLEYSIDLSTPITAGFNIPQDPSIPIPITTPNGTITVAGMAPSGYIEVYCGGETYTGSSTGEFALELHTPIVEDDTPTEYDNGSHGVVIKMDTYHFVLTLTLRKCDLVMIPVNIDIIDTGTERTIEANVYNSKDTYICTEIEVAFYQDFETDNETYIGADTIAGIEFYEEPLAYGIASVTFTLPPGQHTYTVVVDPDNLIDELNETNNIASSDEEYTNVPPVAKIHVNKDTVLTYEKIHFDASLSTDVDSPIWDYRWDFDPEQDAPDDGNPETTWDNDGIPDNDEDAWGMLVDHIYTDGTKVYTVTLIVTDIEGASDKTTIEITVYNRPPTLNYKIIKEDQIIFEKFDASSSEENEELIPIYIKPGVLLTFDASPSTDMDGTISTYTWDFDDGTIETTAIVEHAFEYERPYKVEITITDDDSVSVSDTILIIVENDPPIPVIRPIPSEVMTLVELTFSATDSYDLDGEIMNYTWDFGDNTIEYGDEVTHAYVDDGNYTINLTVTDNGGKTNFTTVNISVLNRAPIPALQVTPSTEVEINTELTFDASASMDLDGTLMYLFDFGDGNSTAWQTEPVATYIYTITGTYTVTLMVRDDDFAINTTAVELRIYKNQLPIAGDISYEPASPVIGEPVTFRAVGYYDPDKDGYVAKFKFDFGDGTDSGWITSSSTSHVYDEIGAYKVTLIVQDDKGGESVPVELTIIVNKSALPPSDEKDKRAVQPGVISGAVIGGIIAAVIVTIIIVMLLLLRRRRSRREKPPGEEELPQPVPQQRLPPRPISVTRLPPGEQRQPPQPPQPQPPPVYQMTQTPPQSPPVYQAPSISSRVRPPEQPP